VTFALLRNFFAAARGLIFKDSASVTWSFNQNTNEITATAVGGGGGSGTVTSVDVQDTSGTPILASSGGPVTTSGTIDLALVNQAAKKVLIGPTSGGAVQPTFRLLVAGDIPTIPASGVSGLATVATSGHLADLTDVNVSSLVAGNILVYNKLADSKWDSVPNYQPLFQRGASFSGGSFQIVVPTNNVPIYIPEDCVITDVEVLTQGGTGSCVLDIWKVAYASYPPVIGNSITASAKPTISSGIKYKDSTLTGWTTNCSAGDTLLVNLSSCTTFTSVLLTLTFKMVGSTQYDGYTDARAISAVSGNANTFTAQQTFQNSVMDTATQRPYTGPCSVLASDATFTSTTALVTTGMPGVTVPAAGTYLVECLMAFYEVSSGTGGAKFDFAGGGASISAFLLLGDQRINGTASQGISVSNATVFSGATIATTPAGPDFVRLHGTVTFSSSGTFLMRGAQNSNSANATHFLAGSYLKLTRVS
jgi:hypothetical protein